MYFIAYFICKRSDVSFLLYIVGSGYKDESINLMPFFSPSCYNGFTDDAKVLVLSW